MMSLNKVSLFTGQDNLSHLADFELETQKGVAHFRQYGHMFACRRDTIMYGLKFCS